jgi:hypothetical protein
MVNRSAGRQRDGRQCGAPPTRGETYCLWHSPEREDEAAEARRLGGLRRKRERTVAGAYELEGLASIPALRRILEVVAVDTLSLDNGIARSRTLIALVATAAKLIEVGELEERIAPAGVLARGAPGTHARVPAGRPRPTRDAVMTAERRVDRLESGLPPKEATLLWLQEAHQRRSLVDYCNWLVDRPLSEAPLEHIRRQAFGAIRQTMRGVPYEEICMAEEQAVRDVAFHFQLVIRINATAEEAIRLATLRYRALFWEMRAISAETRDEDPRDTSGPRLSSSDRWVNWHTTTLALRSELSIRDGAFALLEARYLDGHGVRFRM